MDKKVKFDSKNVVVNKEPLAITKIGEIENEEQNPLLFLFIIFAILISFSFFLPNIMSLFNKSEEDVYNTTPKIEDKKPVEEKKEDVYYDLSQSLVIKINDNLKMENISFNDKILTFILINNTTNSYNINKNYFIEFYTENKTLLERVMIKKDNLRKDEGKSYTYEINSDVSKIKKIRVVEKEENDYPNVEVTKNDLGEENIVCVKKNDEITYKFKENKLVAITNEIRFNASEPNYEINKENYQKLNNQYNEKEGIISNFVDFEGGFVFNANLDLKNMKNTNKINSYYYGYDTLAKVVNFEMNAQGFSCK